MNISFRLTLIFFAVLLSALLSICITADLFAENVSISSKKPVISGIYPHLAMFNSEAECGTGAVVPYADRLWALTYGPHLPLGSSDKLYEITPELEQIVRPESVGGTHANRMIHKESQQLIIGPYIIDKDRQVRVIHPKKMPGRLTGNARHLQNPEQKVYFGTMEEGLYEVDVNTLEVVGLIKDGNKNEKSDEDNPAKIESQLPGYHGKGLFSGQGRLVYANNGDAGPRVMVDPSVPSGALAEWRGNGASSNQSNTNDWTLVRRNQFTDVTGPGGIFGNEKPETDPIWSIGWDHRSLILMLLDQGKWHTFRLPKSSHTYDGAHGWHTEWPRIRDIDEENLLMTMHGAFWKFPKSFCLSNSSGIVPRSNYLKIIGDFCNWNGRIVFGCDDTAKSEFTNKRKAKGKLIGPGQSQSNLWFVEPEMLDKFGPVIGRGAVWINDSVTKNVPSDSMLFAGYDYRTLFLRNDGDASVSFTIEADEKGNNEWKAVQTIEVSAGKTEWCDFPETEKGVWIRLIPSADAAKVTAMFNYRNKDTRSNESDSIFAGLAKPDDEHVSGGIIHARGENHKTLRFIASNEDGELGCYDFDAEMQLKKVADVSGMEWTRTNAAIITDVLVKDAASILYEDAKGRWRLPYGNAAFRTNGPLGEERICREVCTERDLFNAGGTFFELPTENAEGFAKIRPLSTHNRRIKDYASYRGMVVLTGVSAAAISGTNLPENPHIIKSDDGKCALWIGVVDDLWKLGKVRGIGGPWNETPIAANVPSDPYLMTGYDKKTLTLSHSSPESVDMRIEVDLTGTGIWSEHIILEVPPNQERKYVFPDSFSAYWVRLVPNKETTATATFIYE
ncbi:MAG: hypothetical protein ACRCUY_01420 [Thermoguttaceae bacterium]